MDGRDRDSIPATPGGLCRAANSQALSSTRDHESLREARLYQQPKRRASEPEPGSKKRRGCSKMPLSWGWGFMRNAIASLACVVLLGCATASGTMLSENTALVSAEGSGPAYRDKVVHDVLAEAARLQLQTATAISWFSRP